MSEQDPEMGKWDPNPNEPREPFLPDEMFEPSEKNTEVPSLRGLHKPKKPVTKEGIQEFLTELKPFIFDIQKLSRKDQHTIGGYIQELKDEVHSGDFSDELRGAFEKVATHFSGLLLHSAPIDQEAVLEDIQHVESML